MGRLDTSTERAGNVMPLPLQIALGVWLAAVSCCHVLLSTARGGICQPRRGEDNSIPRSLCSSCGGGVSGVDCVCQSGIWRRGNVRSDAKSASSAELGFLFTVLATASGMVFARIQWGSAWNWDPRETSILMLMIVYAAYFALRSAIPDSAARGRISAAYNILACLVMPFLVFVLPMVMGSLHPSGTLTSRGGLSPEYRIVLAAAMLGFVWLYVWLLRMRINAKVRKLGL